MGCFGSDQRPWLTEIQIFVLRLTKIVSGRARFNATETEFPAPKPPPASPNRGLLAKAGPWVPWGSWGCFGVLRFRPEPASGVWLPKSNFGYLPYDSGKAAARASTPQKPNFRLSNRPFGWPGCFYIQNITLERPHNESPHHGGDFRYPPATWPPKPHSNVAEITPTGSQANFSTGGALGSQPEGRGARPVKVSRRARSPGEGGQGGG